MGNCIGQFLSWLALIVSKMRALLFDNKVFQKKLTVECRESRTIIK